MKSKTIKYSKPIVCPITITDHYPILLSIENLISKRNNKPDPLTITTINYSILSNLISNQKWSTILEHSDVNNVTECFINTINNLKNWHLLGLKFL